MYLRWKTQQWKISGWHCYDDGTPRTVTQKLCAVLVVSERRGGKPRQRVVKHLASINADCKHIPPFRHAFLCAARASLDTLNLPDEQRASILRKVETVIPPMSLQETANLETERAETERRLEERRQRKEKA